ncbi:aldo/keto reductase [Jannaschia sp. LMIT008]|uniref:aldo/keto reductase n=1 Tax=Jannaschia maritima TaxID=3032585 RepID=UPI0028115751|nr:aldo/keto reductase [Jannaschia sp. LMIT008]
MPTAPLPRRRLPRSGIDLSVLGVGGTGPGGLFEAQAEATSRAMLDAALDAGVRHFDTAPFYGFGLSERIVGDALRGTDAVLSTKAGRLLRPGAHSDPAAMGWPGALPFTPVFDYGHDAILRSFEDSLQRLGRDRIDILHVHDIGRITHGDDDDRHRADLLGGGGLRALQRLRDEGAVRAIGLGVNEVEVCLDLLDRADWDAVLLAGRYTLLDQTGLDALLPRARVAGTAIVCGGPFNSGILVGGTTWNYADAPPDIVSRVRTLADVAREHGVPLPAMALQFPLAHPAVASVLPGPRSAAHVTATLEWARTPVPPEAWAALRDRGALHADAPVPDVNPFTADPA